MPDKEISELEFTALKYAIEDVMDDLERLQVKYRGQTGVNYMRPLRLAPRKRRESFEDSILREEARAMPYARNCEAELMARIIPTECECNAPSYPLGPCKNCGGLPQF